MSGQEIGKKMVEREELDHFIEAYEYVTGQRLIFVRSEEHPDFICARPDGTLVGVELTKGEGDVKVMELIRSDQGECDFGYTALEDVFRSLNEKEELRQGNWTLPNSSILVVQMFFHSVANVGSLLTPDLQADFEHNGFAEVWLADYTTVEPYGGVELFGLKPRRWWGYHEREDFPGKPYG
jgi:hypothetical protein